MQTKEKSNNKFLKRQKYTYSLLILSIIFLTAFTSYSILTKHLKDEIVRTNLSLLDNNRMNIDTKISSLYNLYMNLTMKNSVKDFMYDNISDEYSKYKNMLTVHNELASAKSLHHLDSVYLYSARSNSIISDSGFSNAMDFHDMEWKSFLTNMSKDSIYTLRKRGDLYTQGSDYFTIVYTYPTADLYDESAIVFNISESSFFNSPSVSQDGSDQFSIIDHDGKILSHSNKQKLYSYANNLDFYSKISNSDQGYINVKTDGVASTIFYTTSPITNWKFVRVTPNSPFKTVVSKIITRFIPLLILIIACALFLIKLVNPWIYKPVYRFIDMISQKARESSGEFLSSAQNIADFDSLEDYFYNIIEENKSYNEQIMQSMPIMKWKFITDILLGNNSHTHDICESLKFFDIELFDDNFLVMLVAIDKSSDSLSSNDSSKDDMCVSLLSSHCESILNSFTKGTSILQQDKKINIILSFDSSDKYKSTTIAIAEKLRSFATSFLGTTITIAVGDLVNSFDNLSTSYVSAQNALKYKGIIEENSILWASSLDLANDSLLYDITVKISAFHQSAEAGDISAYKTRFDEIWNTIQKERISFDSVMQASSMLFSRIMTFASDYGIDFEFFNKRFEKLYSKLYSLETIEAIKKYQNDVFNEIFSLVLDKFNASKKNCNTDKIIKYVNENYKNPDMSLTHVSQALFLSEQYLSKIFKQATGTSFSSYLINLRINDAKQLLATTTLKINDIASLVGYTNIHSFIKTFKKQVGITPLQYRSIKS